jgi:hypothetical protein
VPKEVTHVTQKALKAGPAGAAMVKAWMSAATAHGYNRQVAMSPVNL